MSTVNTAIQQSSSHTPQPHDGWLTRLKHWVIGRGDPIEEQLRDIARQGSGMARLAHAAGFVMLVLFSLGSAVGICASLLDSIIHYGPLSWQALPDDIAISVSLMLVFCMDLASIYASFMVRLLGTRRAPWTDYVTHVAVIVAASILESATFAYMSWLYDNPVVAIVAALILVRAIAAPPLAIYLNLARPIPVGASDIMYHSFLATGRGVIREMIHIANDETADLARKMELFGASAVMRERESERLNKLIAAAQNITADAPPMLPRGMAVGAAATLSPTRPIEHRLPPMRAAQVSNYGAMHGEASDYPITDEVSGRLDDDDWYDDDDRTTASYSVDELRQEIAASTSGTRKSGRSAVHSGPKGTTNGRDSRAEAISKGMKLSHKQRKEETRLSRKRLIKELLFEILSSHKAAGMPDKLTPKELAEDVFRLADGRLIVRPSEYTIDILLEEWQQRNAREQRRAAAEQTMDRLDGIEPMEPQEIRELQEVWA